MYLKQEQVNALVQFNTNGRVLGRVLVDDKKNGQYKRNSGPMF